MIKIGVLVQNGHAPGYGIHFSDRYTDFSDKRTVSIKRTVWNLLKKSLLNVPYDPYIGKIIG